MHLTDWLIDLHGHKRRVGYIEWHPTAENILVSAGFDHLVGNNFKHFILKSILEEDVLTFFSCLDDSLGHRAW